MSLGPYPEFSWSVSRAGTFAFCPRKYWFRYHGGWGGWEDGAPERRRAAWLIGKRTSLAAWAGQEVHRGIAEWLRGDGGIEGLVARVRDRMRRDFALSRERAFLAPGRAKAFGLVEHYYDESVDGAAVRAAWQQVEACLRSIAETDFREAVRDAERAGRTAYVEDPTSPDFEAKKLRDHGLGPFAVFAAPDLVLERPMGTLEILDWKTGAVPRDRREEEVTVQLAFCALWAGERFGLPRDGAETFEVHLPEMRLLGGRAGPDDFDRARAFARESVASIRACLRDPDLNVGLEDDFPAQATPGKCAVCEFRGICAARDSG